MKQMSPDKMLEALQANLRHFEDCPDVGDAEAVAYIRRQLEVRIREAEGLARILEVEALAQRGNREQWKVA